ncbi:AMP-binding protein, partial [Streptococcus anginosus]|nr:AMP-binding protein [Streptococcus anginosus]
MPLDGELAARWEETSRGLIVEGYGMTEASPIILGSPLSPARRPGTLGLPFPSTEVRIVNPDNIDEDVPDGQVGELI